MITSPAFAGKRYAVLGLARSGAATVDALLASGAEVVAWDEDPFRREEVRSSRVQTRSAGSESETRPSTTLGTNELGFADPLTLNLRIFDAVVVSPGIPLNTHPIALAAHGAGVPVIGDIELFAQARASLPAHKVVGVTGTNGKSTTTALVHHILRTAGVPTTMGGNIGLPILAQEPLPEGGVYVLELSSYQIDLTRSLDCDVAVLLNITPDHLERYGSFEAYAASKSRLFQMQTDHRFAIVDYVSSADEDVLDEAEADLFIQFIDDVKITGQAAWPALQGSHNAHNVAAATLAARALAVDEDSIASALTTFPGLPHRMERVAERQGVVFINDSKATNPDSAAPALAAFDAVHWILGGRAKGADLDACVPHLGHLRAAYTIGEAGPVFAQLLEPHVPVSDCGTLEAAVRRAAAAAGPGEVVLLSPAAASFDQFRDFEARGDAFRAAVEALSQMSAA